MTGPITPERHRDFSAPAEPVTFTIAPDTFICRADISLDDLAALTETYANASSMAMPEQVAALREALAAILTVESYDTLATRTAKGAPQPIGMVLVTSVLPWLLEMFGLRPTEPSSDSVPDGGSDAPTSTGGDSPTDSTS
jgi:hypothetical protein